MLFTDEETEAQSRRHPPAPGHTVLEWESWDLSPVLLGSRTPVLSTHRTLPLLSSGETLNSMAQLWGSISEH